MIRVLLIPSNLSPFFRNEVIDVDLLRDRDECWPLSWMVLTSSRESVYLRLAVYFLLVESSGHECQVLGGVNLLGLIC